MKTLLQNLLALFLLVTTAVVNSEDGLWLFLEKIPEDAANGYVGGIPGYSVPIEYNGELIIERNWGLGSGDGNPDLLGTDGTVIGTYFKVQDATNFTKTGTIKYTYINNSIVYDSFGRLISWDGIAQVPIYLTDETVQVNEVKQCDPDPVSGDQAFFTATTVDFGKELWITDGTINGTHILQDIAIGSAGSEITFFSSVPGLAICNGSDLLFRADDGIRGREVWKADKDGAVLLRDSVPGSDFGIDHSLKLSVGTDVPVYLGRTECLVSNVACRDGSAAFPFGFVDGVMRTTLDGGLSPLKFTIPAGLPSEGSIIGFREFNGLPNYTISNKIFYKSGVEIPITGEPNKIYDFPSFSILTTKRIQGIIGDQESYILNGLTESRFDGMNAITDQVKFYPYRTGFLFAGGTGSAEGIWFTDGTVSGTVRLVTGRPNEFSTPFNDSFYLQLIDTGNVFYRYGPAANPEIGFLGTLTINEDSSLNSNIKYFIVGGSVVAFADLVTTAESLDTTMLLDSNLVVNGTSSMREIKLQPSPDQFGNLDIKLTVTDHRGWTVNTTVPVNILAVNDQPSFTIPSEITVPSGVAGTFNIPNFVNSIDLGPNEGQQMVSEFIIAGASNNISDINISTSGDLEITTDGEVFDDFVFITMRDNGGTERNGIDLSTSRTLHIYSALAIDVKVEGEYIGIENGSHIFEYTITNSNQSISLLQSNLSIITSATMLDNAVTTCITVCSETISGIQTQMSFSLASNSSAIIRISGDFDINSNPGVMFSSSLEAIVQGSRVDDNLGNNSVLFELPQIVFASGFE